MCCSVSAPSASATRVMRSATPVALEIWLGRSRWVVGLSGRSTVAMALPSSNQVMVSFGVAVESVMPNTIHVSVLRVECARLALSSIAFDLGKALTCANVSTIPVRGTRITRDHDNITYA